MRLIGELGGRGGCVLASGNCRKARVQPAAQRILASEGWGWGVEGLKMKRCGAAGIKGNGSGLNIS